MNVLKDMDNIYNSLVKISVNSITLKVNIQKRNQLKKTKNKDNRLIIELNKIINFTSKELEILELII